MKIKALTLYQPWATLIAIGAKQFETRSWKTDFRGSIAIHAGADKKSLKDIAATWEFFQKTTMLPPRGTFLRAFMEAMGLIERWPDVPVSWLYEAIPLRSVVAIAELVDIQPTETVSPAITSMEQAFGDYTPGRYAWKLDNVIALPQPVPARGGFNLWTWDVPDMGINLFSVPDAQNRT